MINLLPDSHKKEIRAARNNVILLRYNFLLLCVAGFLLAASLVVYAVLFTTKNIAEATSESNTQKAAEYSETIKKAEEYRKNLETAAKILDNEIIYTDRVFAITELLPAGVVLDNINLSAQTFGTQTIIQAYARDYKAAIEFKEKFNSPLFSNVHFQSVSASATDTRPGYPINVSLSVTVNKVEKNE